MGGAKIEKAILAEIRATEVPAVSGAASTKLSAKTDVEPAEVLHSAANQVKEASTGAVVLNEIPAADAAAVVVSKVPDVNLNEVPAADAAEVNEVEEATAVDLNKEDASANVVVLQEVTHAPDEVKIEDTTSAAAVLKGVSSFS